LYAPEWGSRIGIALSVLWLFGFPIYLTADINKQADAAYQLCSAAGQALRQEIKTTHAYCWPRSGHVVIQDVLRMPEAWSLTLGALAVLWLGGGIIFGMVRWIGRCL
jgi:hypothetical protein